MLGRRLPSHSERLAQLPQRLPTTSAGAGQQSPPRRVGQGSEYEVLVAHFVIMQVSTCICQGTPDHLTNPTNQVPPTPQPKPALAGKLAASRDS